MGTEFAKMRTMDIWYAHLDEDELQSTRAFIVLLQDRDRHDPLFLQVKEATRSALEGHVEGT